MEGCSVHEGVYAVHECRLVNHLVLYKVSNYPFAREIVPLGLSCGEYHIFWISTLKLLLGHFELIDSHLKLMK